MVPARSARSSTPIPSPSRVTRSPRLRRHSGDVGHVDRDQVHRDAAGHRAALPGDDRLGARLRVARAGGAQEAVRVADRDDREARRALRGPGRAVADGRALLDRAQLHDARLRARPRAHRVRLAGRRVARRRARRRGAPDRDARRGPRKMPEELASDPAMPGNSARTARKRSIWIALSGCSSSEQAKWLITSAMP